MFCSNANNMTKLTTAAEAKRGCVNLQTPGSHQSSLNKSRDDGQDKAIIGLGSDKNYTPAGGMTNWFILR